MTVANTSTDPADGGFFAAYSLLVELCQVGARPPVIRALVPDVISTLKIHATYQVIRGASPPQGQLPNSVPQHLKTPLMRLHTTAVATTFEKTVGLPFPQRCLSTYKRYLGLVGAEDAAYDFNRVWFLCRAMSSRLIEVLRCRRCGNRFATNTEKANDARNCPCCAIAAEPVTAVDREVESTLSRPADRSAEEVPSRVRSRSGPQARAPSRVPSEPDPE